MSETEGGISEVTVADLLASSGLKVTAEEVGAVARALARIEEAARLLAKPDFDDTFEQYYRLLEQDREGGKA